jgi:hypothetical protein
MSNESSTRTITVYTTVLAQIIIVSTGGLAASVAILQVAETFIFLVVCALIGFILANITALLAMMGILGQSSKEHPDLNNGWLRGNALISVLLFLLSLVSIGVWGGLSSRSDSLDIQGTNQAWNKCSYDPDKYFELLPPWRRCRAMEFDQILNSAIYTNTTIDFKQNKKAH